MWIYMKYIHLYLYIKVSPLCGCSPVHLPAQAGTPVGVGVSLQAGFSSLLSRVLLPSCSSTPPNPHGLISSALALEHDLR